ncbi:MAG: DUF1800 domain-containing protein [Spirosomaceae bacterium]|jgi:uncharacterized protein (DUF1800 family)|nr:DUF1800 domain-containing protein [Spirosomataceae bacterium]
MKPKITLCLFTLFGLSLNTFAQQTVKFGMGNTKNVTVTASSQDNTGIRTLIENGYLPNHNQASRFLSQATLGPNMALIQNVTSQGREKWLDEQLNLPVSFNLTNYLGTIHQSIVDSLNRNPANNYTKTTVGLDNWHFDVTWFQGAMTAPDVLRWRVALALSEIFVVSRISDFNPYPYALTSYYDVLMRNAFGNYRTLLNDISYHPTMGSYLTFLNNHATSTTKQIFPDENYAREVMQLFSIGLYQLNIDGTEVKDANNKPIPTYDNNDIAGLAKVFTGLSWGDSRYLGDTYKNYLSYTLPMKFYGKDSLEFYRNYSRPRVYDAHEPGTKTFLGQTIPARDVMQGNQDIQDAINILSNHPNVGPFISRRLIQRLVMSNPSPEYIARVATVFNDNGSGVRGDLKAVIKAILLDPDACGCPTNTTAQNTSGMLREPFVRYMNVMRGLTLTTQSGVYRNIMYRLYDKVGQVPLFSPSVFNFFQPDYAPEGELKAMGKVAPEFQILNSQTLTGYINALNEWFINDDPTDWWGYFSGERYKADQDPRFNLTADYTLTRNDKLPQLLDKYNLLFAHGSLSSQSLKIIKDAISSMPYSEDANGVPDSTSANRRVRLALVLILSSPDYLINR